MTTSRRLMALGLLAALMISALSCSLRKQEPTSITPSLINEFYLAAEAGDMYSVQYWAEKFPGLLIAREKDYGLTALHGAVAGGHRDVAEFLLTADPENNPLNIRSKGGNSPLMEAVALGRKDLAILLLDRGADLNLQNNVGDTPLHRAAAVGNLEMAQLLMNRGAELDAPNRDDQTPLYLAAHWGRTELVKFLLDRGADPNFHDLKDRTPLTAALNRNHEATAELIRQRGGSK